VLMLCGVIYNVLYVVLVLLYLFIVIVLLTSLDVWPPCAIQLLKVTSFSLYWRKQQSRNQA
jgi:uncharacterized membrane protein